MDPLTAAIFAHLEQREAGTFDLRTGRPATSGFAYNPSGRALLRVRELSPSAVAEAISLATTTYLGTWRHPNGFLVFLDTVVTNDEDAARQAVRATGQLAYFDLDAEREIRL